MNKTNQPTNQLNELQKRPGTVINMEEGDGDNSNGLIRWAKRKFGSIMWRMVPTSTTTTGNNNTSSNSNKRQKKIGRFFFDDDLNNNDSNKLLVALFSPGLPLTKLMSYLEPCDILNCIQTCQKWKIDLNKDEIWYEVLAAKQSSSFSSSRNSALDTIISSNSNTSKLNYRNIAIAMSRKMNDYEEVIPKTFPQSKLNLKDVLVVIEIRDNDDYDNDTNNNNYDNNYKQLGSFCSDLTELTEDKPGHSKYISYDSTTSNKDSFSNIFFKNKIDDDDDGCEVACINFEMSSRLIRHDTGQCVVLNDYESIRYYKGDMEGCFMTDNELKPKGKNLSGTIARDVCWQHNYNHIGFDLDFIMERLSDFEYKIKSFQFKLTVSKGSSGSDSGDDDSNDDGDDDDDNEEEFNSMNHFLLFLEGLDWK